MRPKPKLSVQSHSEVSQISGYLFPDIIRSFAFTPGISLYYYIIFQHVFFFYIFLNVILNKFGYQIND